MFTYTISGNTPSKKNSKQLVPYRGRWIIVAGATFKKWYKPALKEISAQKKPREPINQPCKVFTTIYWKDRRAGDISNKAESIHDLLVDAGILEDDNWKILVETGGKFGGIDKENPRAEVEITLL